MRFKTWLKLDEMATFSVSPEEKAAVPCGMIQIAGIPCKNGIIGALDMRFEGPPAYEPPFNKFNNGSKFIAKMPGMSHPAQYLVYHGIMKPAEVMFEEDAHRLGYPKVPDYWFERAELYDADYNQLKPALGDFTGERAAMGLGGKQSQ